MMQDELCWDNLSVDTQIPELRVCPDHMQIFMFSAITWNRHHIHYNKDAAVNEGLPDVVVQRGLIGNYFARLITNWVGDRAELRRLTWKVSRSALPGIKLVCRAGIREKVDEDTGHYLVCEVVAETENGERIASGDATVVFTANQSA